MIFSPLVERIAGEESDIWDIHYRAADMARDGQEVIFLTTGDPDLETPQPIIETAVQSIYQGRTHYTHNAGVLSLRQAVANYHNRYAHKPVTANNVVIVAGAQCGLFATALCLLSADDEVIIPDPMYLTYPGVIGASGASIVRVPLSSQRHFQLDTTDVAAVITPRTRAILLTNPHNPTGSIFTQETLVQLVKLACKHDLWLIMDEVYSTICFDRSHVSMASLPNTFERCVTISSLSKSLSMTGWRIGWVIAPEPLAAHLEVLLGSMLFGSPPFIQDAAAVALEQFADEMQNNAHCYQRRRDIVCDTLATAPNLSVHRPEGGIYVMVDVRQTGLSSGEFAEQLLRTCKIALLPMDAFGVSTKGHIRISLTVPEPQLLEACQRIKCFAQLIQ